MSGSLWTTEYTSNNEKYMYAIFWTPFSYLRKGKKKRKHLAFVGIHSFLGQTLHKYDS